jgi:AcrR family transcriptional regulator
MPRIVDKKERALGLVRAAQIIFAKKGFDATRIEDVAKQAGVSKGLMYEYFRSKEDLFFAVCDQLAAKRPISDPDSRTDLPVSAVVEKVASNYDWTADFFLVLIDYWAKILKGSPRQRRKYLQHVEAFYAERRREFAEFLASHRARSDHHLDVDPTVLANLVIACVEGIHMQEFLCSGGARKDDVLALLADLIGRAELPTRR